MVKLPKPLLCSICDQPIEQEWTGWTQGHNAQPINNGRCCGICNDTVVIPARLAAIGLKLGGR